MKLGERLKKTSILFGPGRKKLRVVTMVKKKSYIIKLKASEKMEYLLLKRTSRLYEYIRAYLNLYQKLD